MFKKTVNFCVWEIIRKRNEQGQYHNQSDIRGRNILNLFDRNVVQEVRLGDEEFCF